MKEKTCAHCGKVFSVTPKMRRRYCSKECKWQHREASPKRQGWRKEHSRRYMREYRARTLFGLTPRERQELFNKAAGKCALCGKTPDGPLHIDHNHLTGKVRGLLCQRCNMALGLLDDDSIRLRRAADYVEGLIEQ